MIEIKSRTKPEQLSEILKDPERKSIYRMFYELVYLSFVYKELPVHYFTRYLFKKEAINIRNYLPNKLIKDISPYFNNQRVKEVVDNKLYFHLFYSQFNISLPKILMYNHQNMFVAGNRYVEVNNVRDFKVLLEDLFKQNTSYDSIFIKKTYSGASGRDIYKLFLHQFRKDPELIDRIYSDVIKSEFLFQETVRQHRDLDKLNPSSLNTIRFDTFIDKDRNVEIISGFIKMSTNNSHVDNSVAGGCGVGIDLETGRLKKTGYSKIKVSGVKLLTEHPVTKTKFENLKIPYLSQAEELVLNAARLMPGLRLVGWDVAIGESGPVLIEGNSDYGINSNDLMYGGYMANKAFRKVLREYNYL
jgi:hypothetical protein